MPSSALTESLSKPPTTGAIETAIDEAALDRIFNDVMQVHFRLPQLVIPQFF
jgi:hypothetical protein